MAGLKIQYDKLTPSFIDELTALCPFGAITYESGKIEIGAGCKMCKLCVKKSNGAIIFEDAKKPAVDKKYWNGIAVFADFAHGRLHPVTLELLGKAMELAKEPKQPVYSILIGSGTCEAAKRLLQCGAERVFVYDNPAFAEFTIEPYTNAFADFIEKIHPSSVLVGATNLGRSLAPRVAARFGTGITADCTMLEMKENTDLVQIRPAFGGNIMARIITTNHRPQFCTVRYKVFSQPPRQDNPLGEIIHMKLSPEKYCGRIYVNRIDMLPKETDISEAVTIVAIGRGIKNSSDLSLVERLAELLNAQIACTRPLVENGWFNAKRQIGLSGRTVKPKLIVTIGISGSVQFAAGMSGSECIVAINKDEKAPIFDVAHYGIVGDLNQILPLLIKHIEEDKINVS